MPPFIILLLFQAEIVEKMYCNNVQVYPQVEKEKEHEVEEGLQSWHFALIVGSSFTFLFLVVVGAYLTHRRTQTNELLRKKDWEIPIEDIIFYTTSKSSTTGKSR